MQRLRAGFLALLILGVAWGCGTQTSPGDILTGQVFPEMAVGTLNDSAGTISLLATGASAPGTYANVVTSFRNNLGVSAFQNPGNGFLHFPAAPQLAIGGLFSYGQAPFVNGVVGNPPAYVPASTVGGYATGFIFTGVAPTPGAYSWSAIVTVNGQNQPYGATATLPASPTILPVQSAPVYATGGASGGGTFTVAVPAGVKETLVVVACSTVPAPAQPDPCYDFVNGVVNVGLDIASGEARAGATTITLPAGTLKQGDGYTAIAIGADYPLVEAGPPANTQTRPTLTGSGGTADLTASPTMAFVQ